MAGRGSPAARPSLGRLLICLLLSAAWCRALPDTWAVLVCASRFWYNYRHVANALSVYRLVKRLGVPDSHILLMLADDMPCNARNPLPGTVFRSVGHEVDLCAGGLEVDYKGDEVTVEAFTRVLTGRHDEAWPLSKRMTSSNESRVLLYMTGHGGDGFLKFHNYEEISSQDLSVAFEDMKAAGRFSELFFVVDTCQGGTLSDAFRTPGVLAVGSSARGENSYAHQNDMQLSVALVDRFTDSTCEYLHRAAGPTPSPAGQAIKRLSWVTLHRLLQSYDVDYLKSTPVVKADLFGRPLTRSPASDFFAHADQALRLLQPPGTGSKVMAPPAVKPGQTSRPWWSVARYHEGDSSVESAVPGAGAAGPETTAGRLLLHWVGWGPGTSEEKPGQGEEAAVLWLEQGLFGLGIVIMMVMLMTSSDDKDRRLAAQGMKQKEE